MWQPGGPVAGTYALPPGYSMFNGTSMASPQAAGAAALLVSAAKQTGVQHQPRAAAPGDELVGALPSTRLQRLRAGQRPDRRRRGVGPAQDQHQDGRHHVVGAGQHGAVAASSRRPASARASTTARASRPAQPTPATYTFTRTNGRRRDRPPTTCSWVGNDGTFSSAGVDRAAAEHAGRRCTVTVNPTTAGVALGDPQPRRPVDGRASTTRR